MAAQPPNTTSEIPCPDSLRELTELLRTSDREKHVWTLSATHSDPHPLVVSMSTMNCAVGNVLREDWARSPSCRAKASFVRLKLKPRATGFQQAGADLCVYYEDRPRRCAGDLVFLSPGGQLLPAQ